MKIFKDITQTVGNTPLVELDSNSAARILLKMEFFNPLGSVKDRISKNMIEAAEADGSLKKGMKVVEPTSGNTGIGLAFVCAAKGYPLTLVMPETMSIERRTLLLLLGAKVILTPGPLGMRGALAKALELLDCESGVFMPGQFENPANPKIHKETTGPEIWNDTDGKVDIVVTGVGTGGTLTGVGEFLKSKKPTVQMIAVEPEESPVLSGGKPGPHKIQGIGAGFIPKILKRELISSVEKVTSADAIAEARKWISKLGIPLGISSGAAIVAGLRVASKDENKGKTIVIIIPSYTERYLSTALAEKERAEATNLPVETPKPEYLIKIV